MLANSSENVDNDAADIYIMMKCMFVCNKKSSLPTSGLVMMMIMMMVVMMIFMVMIMILPCV